MRRWRRVHDKRGGVVAVQLFACCAAGATVVIGGLAAARVVVSPAIIGVSVAATVWLVPLAIRKQFTGVFVSDRGMRVRETFRTRTYPWQNIASLVVRSSRYARSGGMPVPALWVVTRTGTAVETPVRRGSFLMAELPANFAWPGSAAGSHRIDGYFLPEPVFDEVVRRLRTELD